MKFESLSQQDREMVLFLQKYIRIKTVAPDAEYQAACDLLKLQAQADGFNFKQIILPSGFPVAIITYPGTNPDLPALMLNHHMDVVPAPDHLFKAEIQDGNIVGRGTQDMKGIGVAHYFALKQLKKNGTQPERTIHLVAVPDEERGGFKGTKEFIETDFFKNMNVGFVLDEGTASGTNDTLFLVTDERKVLQISISAIGEFAHGSRLAHHNPVHELVFVLQNIVEKHKSNQAQAKNQDPGALLSMHITSLTAGVKTGKVIAMNIVPDRAHATIDMRIPPHMPLNQVKEYVESLVTTHKNCSYTVEAAAEERGKNNPKSNELFTTMESVVRAHNLTAKSIISEGASDLRYYLARGIKGIGFAPFTCKNTIHQANEFLPVAQLINGKNIFYDFLQKFCA